MLERFGSYFIYALLLGIIGFVFLYLPKILRESYTRKRLLKGDNIVQGKVVESTIAEIEGDVVTYNVLIEYTDKDGMSHQANGSRSYFLSKEEIKKGYKKHVVDGSEIEVLVDPITHKFIQP